MEVAHFQPFGTWEIAYWQKRKVGECMHFWVGDTDVGNWIARLNNPAAGSQATSIRFSAFVVGEVGQCLSGKVKFIS